MAKIGPFNITDTQLHNVKTGAVVVAGFAAAFASPEVLLTAAGIAWVIKMADRKGLLESDQAKPLKDLAGEIDKHVKLDETLLFNAVPAILRLKLLDKLFPASKVLRHVRTAAELAAKSGVARNVYKRFGHGRGPGSGGGTGPVDPQTPKGPDLN